MKLDPKTLVADGTGETRAGPKCTGDGGPQQVVDRKDDEDCDMTSDSVLPSCN